MAIEGVVCGVAGGGGGGGGTAFKPGAPGCTGGGGCINTKYIVHGTSYLHGHTHDVHTIESIRLILCRCTGCTLCFIFSRWSDTTITLQLWINYYIINRCCLQGQGFLI
jgi:hypothetical protein